MPVTLNASTSSGFVQSADTSGVVQIQSNGSTVLTVASTGVTATNIQGTIVQGTAVASTSGTAIDFTGIPSWAKKITVLFSGVSTNGTNDIIMQLGDAGGFETTGYIGGVSNGLSSVFNSTSFVLVLEVLAASNFSGSVTVSNLTGNTWVSSGILAPNASSGMEYSGGSKTLSEVLTQIRITTVGSTNTFDAGTINLQYEG